MGMVRPTDCTHVHTENSYGSLRPFYFAHKTTGDLACGHLGDNSKRNTALDTWWEARWGIMLWANHMITELGFPAGFRQSSVASAAVLRKQ